MTDPAEQTVDEVVAYAEEHPDEVDQLLEDERTGKNRTTLVSKLESMRQEEETPPEEEKSPEGVTTFSTDPNVYPDPENIPHTP